MAVTVSENYVYLDWAATTPLCEESVLAMQPYLVPGKANVALNANANSLHAPGRAAFEALERARRSFACDINAARPSEIVFTGGATEADNTAIIGLAQAVTAERNRSRQGSFTPHIVISSIEHEAVLSPAHRLKSLGFRVTEIDPDRSGFIRPEKLAAAMGEDTVLVSVQAANSEVGALQPVAELARIAHDHGALFHTDAVQALGKVRFDVQELGIDAASFAAHKICGPKGVGALYVRARIPYQDYLLGGGQEAGRRSGTQNVMGIAGFAAASRTAIESLVEESARQRSLRDLLYARLSSIPAVSPTVAVEPGSEDYLPNVVHVLVEGYESETLVLRLDMKGFGVSGGSACSSHSLEPSHVLKSMGIDSDAAYGALRISFGRFTTEADIEGFIVALRECLDWQ